MLPTHSPGGRLISTIFLFLFLLILNSTNAAAQFADELSSDSEVITAGEAIFNTTCIACHSIKDRIVGPPLSEVYNRRPKDWTIRFVQNSQEVLKSGDEYATELFTEYFQIIMPPNSITDDEVMAVMAYVKSQDVGERSEEPIAEEGAAQQSDETLVAEGETLFKGNCTVCHAINNTVIGPPLRDVHTRRDLDWIVRFVTNSQKVIQGGDEYAVKLYQEYNRTEMPAFDFSEGEITSIVEYIKSESAKPAEGEVADAEGAVAEGETAEVEPAYLQPVLVGLVVVLVLILVVLIIIARVLQAYLAKQSLSPEDHEIVGHHFDLSALVKSNGFLFLAVFIFTLAVFYKGVESLFIIGVQQNYSPTQPIAFSHKVHAGQFEIDCQYCHTGVRKSKNASIPSPNICMNCHSAIKSGTNTGEVEIGKIYAALDYDPQTQQYGPEPKPIEWVRVHNLPDLAYFNHSQHVGVAKLECQTCHGEIQEMEVVAQHANLTMGWCISCHRETPLNTRGNAYYDNLVELHAEEHKEPMTVEDNGGLECAKCHY